MHDSRPQSELSRGVFFDGCFRAGLREAHEMRYDLYGDLIAFCVTFNPRRELLPDYRGSILDKFPCWWGHRDAKRRLGTSVPIPRDLDCVYADLG